MENRREAEITVAIIFRTILMLLVLVFLYLIREILALLFIALIIVSVIDPVVDWLQDKKIPRFLGIWIVYLFLLTLFGVLFAFIIPLIASQFDEFSNRLPEYLQGIQVYLKAISDYFSSQNIAFDPNQITNQISQALTAFSNNIISTTFGIFSGFISFIAVLSLVFYMTVRKDGIKNFIVFITPDQYKNYAAELVIRIKNRMGGWMRGQLMVMLLVFALDFIGLSIIGVPFALVLAIIAGLLEIVPYVGPIIGAIPGIILGFIISPLTGILAALIYFVVQQFESNVFLPQVMKRTVGLNPIVVILSLLVGFKLGGVLGVILSVPLATVFNVFVEDFFKEKK